MDGPARAVLSLATDEFTGRLARMEESLRRTGFDGAVRAWRGGEYPPGSPTHDDVPFAFKPFAFAAARGQGVDVALWMDASCVVLHPLDPLFAQIEIDGYLLFANGRNAVGAWAGDVAIEWLGVSRDEALGLREVNAAAVGLDFRHEVAHRFLDAWVDAARAGTPFRGVEGPLRSEDDYGDIKWNRGGRVSADPRVEGHRHDQTVAGVLAHRLGMKLSQGLYPYTPGERFRRDTRIAVARDEVVDVDDLYREMSAGS